MFIRKRNEPAAARPRGAPARPHGATGRGTPTLRGPQPRCRFSETPQPDTEPPGARGPPVSSQNWREAAAPAAPLRRHSPSALPGAAFMPRPWTGGPRRGPQHRRRVGPGAGRGRAAAGPLAPASHGSGRRHRSGRGSRPLARLGASRERTGTRARRGWAGRAPQPPPPAGPAPSGSFSRGAAERSPAAPQAQRCGGRGAAPLRSAREGRDGDQRTALGARLGGERRDHGAGNTGISLAALRGACPPAAPP